MTPAPSDRPTPDCPSTASPQVNPDPAAPPRPGSRAARAAQPMTLVAIKAMAELHGVCTNPFPMRRTDLATGETVLIDLPCGATYEAKCVACARRNKRLRQQQLREGWHRDDEPLPAPEATEEQVGMLLLRADFEYARADCLAKADWAGVTELDESIAELEALMTQSGLRGRIPPNPTPVPDWFPVTEPKSTSDGQHDAHAVPAGEPGLSTVNATVHSGQPTEDDDPDDDDLDLDTASTGRSDGEGRRVRSTRRRQDTPDLPRRPVTARTIGRTFEGTAGRVFRPSTFVTLTLPSYGKVLGDGSPVDPSTYDYRLAAWDAVHYPALLDRLWQNLRRAVGWNVQYFGAVEPQRRLAPHAHFAVRGAIPRATIRQVITATYRQVWWPSTAVVRYPTHAPQPVWDHDRGGYVDPSTREPLRTWDEAMDNLDDELDADPDRGPEHVVRFGTQLDLQGVLAGTPRSEKMIGYLTKYLTKSVSDCHKVTTATAEAHQRRLWEELRVTPCSPRCPNWLRYGVQPMGARERMTAGYCRAKVHQPATLGIGGRRVLVSRQWSGKSLADHRYDQAAWVRNLLQVSMKHEDPIEGDLAARIDAARAGGFPAPIAWQRAHPGDPDLPDLSRRLLRAIATRTRQRAEIAEARAGRPPDPDEAGDVSATGGADDSTP